MSLCNNDYDDYEREIGLIIAKYQGDIIQLSSEDHLTKHNEDRQIEHLKDLLKRVEIENIQLKQDNATLNQKLITMTTHVQVNKKIEELMNKLSQITQWNKETIQKKDEEIKSIKQEFNNQRNLYETNFVLIKKIDKVIKKYFHLLVKCGLIHKSAENDIAANIVGIDQLIDKMLNDNTNLLRQLTDMLYLQDYEQKVYELTKQNHHILQENETLKYERAMISDQLLQLQNEKLSQTQQPQFERLELVEDEIEQEESRTHYNNIKNNKQNENSTIDNNSLPHHPLTNLKEKLKALEHKFKEINKSGISDSILNTDNSNINF